MSNRLAAATSPYLLQHAENPVDWWEWSPEAFADAAARDIPVFLSIGYSSCHWCHVMAHESFEDPEVAAAMNRAFVNIKVDREERPDIDAVYMQAVQALTGQGGWPMSVWLTPDAKPFFAGTYFPPTPRHQHPSFSQVIDAVTRIWTERRDEVDDQAGRLTEAISRVLPHHDTDDTTLSVAFDQLAGGFDHTAGGFGGAPKFPQAPVLDFLLRVAPTEPAAGDHLRLTLDAMAAGGLRDHVGGGFARYSVDARWEIPHFEKMLYDNALLARLYLRTWQADGVTEYRRIAEETIAYVLRDLRLEGGAFASAEDADSPIPDTHDPGGPHARQAEGAFYVWNHDEFVAVTGDDAPVAAAHWGVTPGGNFEGANHLRQVATVDALAERFSTSVATVDAAIERARRRLFDTRESRPRPLRDDKVVVGWNGAMIRTLAEAGALLEDPALLEAAGTAATFILDHVSLPDGRLHRSWAKGRPGPRGVLEDHGAMAMACFSLYQATGDPAWFRHAERLTRLIPAWFVHDGRFVATPHDTVDLITRPVDQMDNPAPSGSSLAVEALWTLALYTGEDALFALAETGIRESGLLIERHPSSVGHLLAVMTSLAAAREVAVVGSDAADLVAGLRRVLPLDAVLAVSDAPAATPPLLAGRDPGDATLAWVCRRFVCDMPTGDRGELERSVLGG